MEEKDGREKRKGKEEGKSEAAKTTLKAIALLKTDSIITFPFDSLLSAH